jgi:uncharacterized membrane-anchored protein
MDNIINFPDLKTDLNNYRMRVLLESLENPEDELAALTQFIYGMNNFLMTLDRSEEIIIQLGYLQFLIEKLYED